CRRHREDRSHAVNATAPFDAGARSGGTRERLIHAAQRTVRETGLANASARTISARAGASQGLIFYHFGTVSDLLAAASNAAVDRSIGSYRTALDGAVTDRPAGHRR